MNPAGQTVSVVPSALEQASQSLAQIAGEIAIQRQNLARAANAASGCSSIAESAFALMQDVWSTELAGLADQIDFTGSKTATAASNYVLVDNSRMGANPYASGRFGPSG